ncbi:MAG: hypothetical protein HVN35_05660 [Methanobacteriaceae archaeon]|nr:hypothetical protein [Methanobacteriaceae archaeon]
MTRSRRYLNSLPNIEKIKEISREILDYELKLDKATRNKDGIKKDIFELENKKEHLETVESPKKMESTRKKLENLSSDLLAKDKEINEIKKHILDLQLIVDKEITEGLSILYHQAKSSLDEAEKNILKHQKLVDESQKNFINASTQEVEKYRHEWIINVEKVIKHKEKAKIYEEEIENIKRVYKREFG